MMQDINTHEKVFHSWHSNICLVLQKLLEETLASCIAYIHSRSVPLNLQVNS